MTSQSMQAQTQEFSLTVAEAAALLGSDERAIRRLIFTARVDAIRLKVKKGHEYRLRQDEILSRREELRERIGTFAPEALGPIRQEPPPVGSKHPSQVLESLARGAEAHHPEPEAPPEAPPAAGEPEVTAAGSEAVPPAPVDPAFAEALDQTLAEVLAALPEEDGAWDAAVELIPLEETQTDVADTRDADAIPVDDFPPFDPAATEDFEALAGEPATDVLVPEGADTVPDVAVGAEAVSPGDRYFPCWAPVPAPTGAVPVWTPTLRSGVTAATPWAETAERPDASPTVPPVPTVPGAPSGLSPVDAPEAMSEHGTMVTDVSGAETGEEHGERIATGCLDETRPAYPVVVAEGHAVEPAEGLEPSSHGDATTHRDDADVEATEEALRILADGAPAALPEAAESEERGGRHTFIDYSRLSARLAAANEKARQAREAVRRPRRDGKSGLTSTLSSLLKRKK
jgi:hypothetical protein